MSEKEKNLSVSNVFGLHEVQAGSGKSAMPQIKAENDGVLVSSETRHRVYFYIQKKKGDPKRVTDHLTLGAGTKRIDGSEFTWNDSHPIGGREYTLVVENIDENDRVITGERVEFKAPIKTDESPTPPVPPPAPTPPADKQAANKLRGIIAGQRRALEQHDRDGSFPEWMDEARLKQMADTTTEVVKQNPDDNTIKVLSKLILANGKLIREALAKASAPAPAKRKTAQKPAPPLETDENHTRIADRVGDLEGNVQEIKGGLEEVRARLDKKASKKDLEGVKEDLGQKIDEGFGVVRKQIANLNKPATDPKTATSGNGGNNGGSDTSGNGNKASADKQPWSLGGSWLGVIVTLAILFVIGLIALCAFQAGWIHKSPAPATVGATMGGAQQLPLVITTTNVVSQPTPPTGGQQSVAAPPTLTPEQIGAYAAEYLRVQAEHNKAVEAFVANATPVPAHQKAEAGRSVTITTGDNSIIAGHDVTVINHNYSSLPPGKPVEEIGGQTATPSANTTSGTFTEIGSSNSGHAFPVDRALFELEFNRMIGMPDRWRYHY